MKDFPGKDAFKKKVIRSVLKFPHFSRSEKSDLYPRKKTKTLVIKALNLVNYLE